jgi:diaminohydroxyphosphoribosylaminopyrimidine deaminase/5-amino-6-(5-phosphoribosylamino)uracil reductase
MSFCKLISFGIQGDTWFDEALREAQKGIGFTHPNPPVGCVIIKDKRLIAKGFHAKAGELHAEAKALELAGEAAHGSTLYVTLEPCNHFGRTPPCTEAIIKAGVKKVIYGVSDPNPDVTGHGAQILRDAGIEVEKILHPQAEALIQPFAKFVQKKQPYVLAKIAVSLDGKIAFKSGEKTQITGPEVAKLVHQMREACDAIIVGSETVLVDNPSLTARFEDRKAVRHPIRIVLDSRLRTHPSHQVYARDGSYVVHSPRASKAQIDMFKQAGVGCIAAEKSDLLDKLAALGMTSLFLEGGGQTLTYFLKHNWIDELAWFTGPILLGNQGVPAIDNLSQQISFKKCEPFQLPSGPNSVKNPAWLILSAC